MWGKKALRRETDLEDKAAGVAKKSLPIRQQNTYAEAAECALS